MLYDELELFGGIISQAMLWILFHPAYSIVSQCVFSYRTGLRSLVWVLSAACLLFYSLLYLHIDNPTFGEASLYPLGVFAASVVLGVAACMVGRRKGKVKKL
jgi:hypothetical protein